MKSLFCLVAITSCVASLFVNSAHGQSSQSAKSQEYIRSTSPLKSGGFITTVTTGSGQTRSWFSADRSNQTRSGRSSASLATRETQARDASEGDSQRVFRQASSTAGGGSAYPYPQSAYGTSGFAAGGSATRSQFAPDSTAEISRDRVAMTDRATGNLGNTETAIGTALPDRFAQLPGRGINPFVAAALNRTATPVARTAQCNCGPNYANPTANYAAGYQGYQPGAIAANSVPALNVQGNAGNISVNPNCCTPNGQFNNVGGTPPVYQFQNNLRSRASALATGSGQYSPLFQFRNMPPGTYLGQGIIGQPTAYVDGQPFRNLLRYIAP